MASRHRDCDTLQQKDDELRIVMVGKTGIGKSATGNTILGRPCFDSKFSATSQTDECSKGEDKVDGQKVAVIDTPGLFDTRCDPEKTQRDLSQCISFSSPGPHVFLVIIRLGRFTEEEKQTVQRIQEMFGETADRYSMVLFTHGDLLEDTTIEEYMEDSPDLHELVAACNGQYHVFNNKLEDRSQVIELFKKIRNIVQKNGGSHYTNEMFQDAERAIEEEKQQILREKEEEIRKEKEELERELRAKYDEKLRSVTEKLQAEREVEVKKEREMEKTQKWQRDEKNRVREDRELKRREERPKEQSGGDMSREREREERESRRRKDKGGGNREIMNENNHLDKQFEKKMQEEMEELDKKHKREARKEAEKRNPVIRFLKWIEEISLGFLRRHRYSLKPN